MFLNEAMYMKDAKLLEIESLVESLCNEAKENNGFNLNKIKVDNRIKKINKLIAEKFNFEGVEITILPEKNVLNGYTFPFYYDFDKYGYFKGVKKEFVSDKNFEMIEDKYGLRYKDSKNKFLQMAFSQFLFINLSVGEIMAVLLHEIGHNFYIVNHYKRQYIDEIMKREQRIKFSSIIKNIIIKKDIRGAASELVEEFEAYLAKKRLQSINNRVGETIYEKIVSAIKNSLTAGNIFSLISLPLLVFYIPLYYLISALTFSTNSKYIKLFKDYDNEVFSDNFAVSYGYGKPLYKLFSTGTRMTEDQIDREGLGLIGALLQLSDAVIYKSLIMNDEHQLDDDRINMAIIKLRYELNNNKDLTKQQREVIQRDIDECLQYLEEIKKDTVKGVFYKTLQFLSKKNKDGLDAKKNANQLDDTLDSIYGSTSKGGILDPYVTKK